jgi:hypothetical protein
VGFQNRRNVKIDANRLRNEVLRRLSKSPIIAKLTIDFG